MSRGKFITVVLMAVPFVALLAITPSLMSVFWQAVNGQEPAKSQSKGDKTKDLLKERLEVAREIEKQAVESYKAGTVSLEEVREATRIVLDAELELCVTHKDRVAVLEKFATEAKKTEALAAELVKSGQTPMRAVLKAKAARLQVEIMLEREKVREVNRTGIESPAQVILAEKQVDIKRSAVKVAEAQKTMVTAKLTSMRAQVVGAQAAEALAEKQVKRFEELVKQQAISAELVDERRTQWESAKAKHAAAKGGLEECEAQVRFEQARVEMIQLELEDAELRLKQLKSCLQLEKR